MGGEAKVGGGYWVVSVCVPVCVCVCTCVHACVDARMYVCASVRGFVSTCKPLFIIVHALSAAL